MNDQLRPAGAGKLVAAADLDRPAPVDPAQQALAEALRLSFGILRLALVALVVAYCLSGLFSVGSNEVALRLRFGEYVGPPGEQVLERGTYLALPFPIEQVITIDTRPQALVLDREFWYETGANDSGTTRAEIRRSRGGPLNPLRDGSLLTADLDIVHARWTVTYRVADPVAYLSNVGNPETARQLVRCAIQQGIVHTIAQLPSADVLKATVNRDAAAGLARDRLTAMETGLTIDQLSLDEVSPPVNVIASVEAVTTAETDRDQRIVAADQERARILSETAGEASLALLALIDAREQAGDSRGSDEASGIDDRIDQALDSLQLGDAALGGEVARRINDAKSYRARVVEQVKTERERFERLLPEYEDHPRLVLSRLWAECRERIFTADVETFYTAPGRLELQLNRDPEVRKERQQEQLRDPAARPGGGRAAGR